MIFAVGNHVEQIKKGLKTQTRRSSDRYQVGKTYAIQPSRTSKAIPDGRILIEAKRTERQFVDWIHVVDAKAEGGYSPEAFEQLYGKLHPNWQIRYAYAFKFVPKELLVK